MDGKKRSIMRGTLAVLGTTAAVVLALFGANASAAAADGTSAMGYEATTESGPRALSDAKSFSSMEERAAGDGSDMTINLHDYSRKNPDINDGHALKFGSVGGQAGQNINAWTGSDGGVYQGIVASTIGENGYPRLASNNGGESLAYLFQSELETAGVTSHDNVTGLFRLDSFLGGFGSGGFFGGNFAALFEFHENGSVLSLWGIQSLRGFTCSLASASRRSLRSSRP